MGQAGLLGSCHLLSLSYFISWYRAALLMGQQFRLSPSARFTSAVRQLLYVCHHVDWPVSWYSYAVWCLHLRRGSHWGRMWAHRNSCSIAWLLHCCRALFRFERLAARDSGSCECLSTLLVSPLSITRCFYCFSADVSWSGLPPSISCVTVSDVCFSIMVHWSCAGWYPSCKVEPHVLAE